MNRETTELSVRSESHNRSTEAVKPGSLIWDEEKLTKNRDVGKKLLRLQTDNQELRKQLRELSERLSEIIQKSTVKSATSPKLPKKPLPEEQTEIVLKRVSLHQKEHASLVTRVNQVASAEYEYKLLNEISAKEAQLKTLEKSRSVLEKGSTKVGNSLISEETVQDAVEYYRMIKELKRYTALVDPIKSESQRNVDRTKTLNELREKLEGKYNQLVARAPQPERKDLTDDLKQSVQKVFKVKERTERLGRSKVHQLEFMAKSLEKDLRDYSGFEETLAARLRDKELELHNEQKRLRKEQERRKIRLRPESEGLSPFIT